jgi:Na+/proline symporter
MGILARALLPDLADPQWGLLQTAEVFLHPLLVGLILAAVFAALRSTADSQLLVASSAVVRDLVGNVLRLRLDDRQAMRISRIVVVVLGLLAVLLALSENRFIFWFVLFSWAGLGASFGPSLILAVWWRRLSPAGVVASMLVGFTTTVVWSLWVREAIREAGGPDVYELVPAFALSLAAALLFSICAPRRDEARRGAQE